MINLIENKSKTYKNGTIWDTINYGKIEIIGRIKDGKFLCKFSDGTEVLANTVSIRIGKVKNYNQPRIYGVGFLGVGKYKSVDINGKMDKKYQTWVGMIQRCYSSAYHILNPTYKNCTVDKRWHNFQNFCKDIPMLDGYEEWLNNFNYALDKDFLIKNNKIYSKDTCCFITKNLNSKIAGSRDIIYVATNVITGDSVEFSNQKEFSISYGLIKQHVSNCIRGRRKSTGGWVFKVK